MVTNMAGKPNTIQTTKTQTSTIGKNIRWGDITKSIKTALKEHPELTRYYVCVPKDLTLNTDKTWNRQVIEWKALAKSETGREVEFHWWGASELSDRLIQTEHAGRLLYWFDEHRFDNDWFKDNWEVARATAGPRYTPELHIDLPLAHDLEMLGRTKWYINEIKSYAKEIRRGRQSLKWSIHSDQRQKDPSLGIPTNELQDLLGIVLEQFSELRYEPVGAPTLQDISESIQNAVTAINEFLENLSQRASEYDAKRKRGEDTRQNPFWERRMQTLRTLSVLQSVLDSIDAEDRRLMVISGDAGTGKTHLLCDVAKKRIDDGLPTVLLMGQNFTGNNAPWSQACEHLDLVGVLLKEFTGALEAAAQAKGQRALLMIDAINEGRGNQIWPNHLAAFLKRIDSPWIAIVLSVRSTYENKTGIIPEEVQKRSIHVEHKGFEGKEYDVIQTFFPYYGLEPLSTPILNPEFSKPLFLKMICEGLQGKGAKRLPRGFQGISEIFDLYINEANGKLAKKLDYDPDENKVRDALTKIAEYCVSGDEIERYIWGLDKRTVKAILDQLLPRDSYEKSLYNGMVKEGLLIESPKMSDQKNEIVVRFSYERFADHIIADFLLEKYLNPSEPEAAFTEGGKLAFLLDEKQYGLRGLIEALSIQVPERAGKELIELVPKLVESKNIWSRIDAREAFRQSMIWRKSDAFSDKTIEFLGMFLRAEREGGHLLFGDDNVLDVLMTVATLTDHPYNADKLLYGFLRQYSMPDRDAWWAIYLHTTYQFEGPVNRLIDWALRVSPEVEFDEDEEVPKLASIALTWTLTSFKPLFARSCNQGINLSIDWAFGCTP